MLRKFIGGLLFGAGLAIGFIVIGSIYLTWILPKQFGAHAYQPAGSETVDVAPPITDHRFLGSTGSYVNNFEHNGNATLAPGDGRLTGRITDGERPVEGLRLRLALNGSVLSQWDESGSDGKYEIPVPHGEYRIDGYELDMTSANRVLSGRIQEPFSAREMGSRVMVKKDRPAEALSLRFVAPVEKLGPHGDVSAKSDIIATWKPYPGAAAYVVQVHESEGPRGMPARGLFRWEQRPRVTEPFVNLTQIKAPLRPGRHYFVEVYAEDASGTTISESADDFMHPDFSVTE